MRAGTPRPTVVGCALATLLLFAGACGDGVHTAHGLVTQVQARSLTEIATFTVGDEAGRSWTFETDGPIEFTPSHLREHMLTGQPVTVYYRDQGERLLAERVAD